MAHNRHGFTPSTRAGDRNAWLRCAIVLAVLIPLTSSRAVAYDGLGTADEKAVRNMVYEGEAAERTPRGSLRTIQVVPDALIDLHKKHPGEVLDLLVKIVAGGRPRDAMLAAGYAISLLNGPEVGVACLEDFDKAKYDVLDKDWNATPREHWLQQIREVRGSLGDKGDPVPPPLERNRHRETAK